MEAMLASLRASINSCRRIARLFGWLLLALVVVICWDVITRKMGFQIPGFGSTPIQELEWHLHGMLFLFWLGYAYVRNVHVRIDVFTGHLSWRRQAWLELLGIGIFAIPYCALATYYSWSFVVVSYLQNESSDAPNGLGIALDHQGLPVPGPGRCSTRPSSRCCCASSSAFSDRRIWPPPPARRPQPSRLARGRSWNSLAITSRC